MASYKTGQAETTFLLCVVLNGVVQVISSCLGSYEGRKICQSKHRRLTSKKKIQPTRAEWVGVSLEPRTCFAQIGMICSTQWPLEGYHLFMVYVLGSAEDPILGLGVHPE